MMPHDAGRPDASSHLPSLHPPRDAAPIAGRIGEPPFRPLHGAAPGGPPALSAAPDVWSLLAALRQRWISAIILSLMLGTLAAGGAWFLLTPKHVAFARIQVAFEIPGVGHNPNEATGGWNALVKTTENKIKTRPIIWAALKRDEVRRLSMLDDSDVESVVQAIEEDLKVESSPNSEILTIQYSHADPHTATVMANAIKEAFISEHIETESRHKAARLTEMERHNSTLKDAIAGKRKALQKVAEGLDGFDPTTWREDRQAAALTLRDLRSQQTQVQIQLYKTKAELEVFEARVKGMRERAKSPAPVGIYVPKPSVPDLSEDEIDAAVEKTLAADAKAKLLQEQLASLESRLEHYKGFRKDNVSRMAYEERIRKLRKQLQQAREPIDALVRKQLTAEHARRTETARFEYEQKLEEAKARERMHGTTGPNLTDDEVVAMRNQLAKQLEYLEKSDQRLTADVNEYKVLATRTLTPGLAYDEIQNDVRNSEITLANLLAGYERAKLESHALPRVSKLQDAELMKRDLKKQILGTIVAPVAMICAVCGGLALLEYRKRKVRSAAEISRGLGIRVVGAVPRMPHLERHLVGPTGESELEGSPVMESIDAIRTRLLHEADARATRVVMVTSATAGEGKTTLAAALASSLARAGRKTLLLDGDLRRPTVHELFEVPQQPGFSEVLLGEIEVAEAAVESMQENLSILPAGQWDREVLLALARDGLEGVFEKLAEEFDFIVVDSHPVLSATDALLLGRQADAVVLSVLREVSQMPRVYSAHQQLTGLGIRVLGAVVSATDPEEVFATPATTAAVA